MNCLKKIVFSLLLFILCNQAFSQDQGLINASPVFNRKRFNTVIISEAGIGTLITVGLQFLWYKNFPKSHFHLFNDNNEWLNMDKIGHATTAYNVAAIQYNLMRWSGENKNSSAWIAGGTALSYLLMVEIFDGFSSAWGFSPGDMAANIAGSSIFVAQQLGWNQQRIQMRFSFHKSIFAKYNPGELGKNFPQRLLKDYNAQSYWLSFNISSFMGKNNFPKWINADFGYGAEGMTGAVTNPSVVDGKKIPEFTRQRKLFFGFSGAFNKNDNIPYPSWINIFRVPSPVVEWKLKDKKIRFRPFYF